jgi:hypothetical protein
VKLRGIPIKGVRVKGDKLVKTRKHLDASKQIASRSKKRIVARAQAIGITKK